ncbi:major facilitator superfamily transporter [Colletotrichum truncatum]|uniref:Major facilitator superfamily transporter n=1 Tax=Colletotrichum truncatum TaxID=5467 RepID=A0ACC3Z2G7_COLTU|nr:major facilitator superfamily transporter [Colletotrichum truncatum]KAF6782731.1 major facilitator superfamily transporter [Colletotrichum truncatum]
MITSPTIKSHKRHSLTEATNTSENFQNQQDEIELERVNPAGQETSRLGLELNHPTECTGSHHLAKDEIFDQSSRLPLGRLIIAYLCLAAIYFVQTLDINSVATALPAIAASLDAGNSITWTGTAYLMGQTVFQALYGRMSDIFGRKPVLMVCIGFLVLGDLLCGFAKNALWLYVCRALSGIGGGGISSLVQITVSDLVSLKDRGKYQGLLSASIGLGASTGPFITASMLNKGATMGVEAWRWIFWVPPILATACALVIWMCLPLKPVFGGWREKLGKIDWYGLGAAMAGILLLLIPLNSGGSIWPWHNAHVIALLVLGAFFLVIFVIVEKSVATIPLIPLRLFSQRSTAVMYVQSALYDSVWQVNLYFLPIYFQEVRGYGPLRSATLVLPLLLVHSTAGVASGPLMSKLGRYAPILFTGMGLWTLGSGLKIVFSRTTSVSTHIIVLVIEGAGIGLVHQPALVALQALSKPEDRAVATSTRNLMRMLGSVVGMAVSTAVQYAVMKSALSEDMPMTLRLRVTGGTWHPGEVDFREWEPAILDAKMKGVRAVFIMQAPLMFLCLIGCWFIPNVALQGDN